MTLIVTGASGQLGRRAAELLLESADPARVVLVTRRPDELADLKALGADVRYGDFDDPASLDSAFAEGERLLLVSTSTPDRRLAQHQNAIEAAVRAEVGHLIYTSYPNPMVGHPGAVATEHRATEELIRESGLQWTLLRNALYSENRVPDAIGARQRGTFKTNTGDGRAAYVSREDCSAAAAGVLGGAGHDGQTYDITGPELLAASDLAEIYAVAGGQPVTATQVDDAAFVAGLAGAGLPEPVAVMLAEFGQAIREGYMDQVSDAVERLTGRPATPLSDVVSPALKADRA